MANATAIRFPDALKAEAKAYADALGISVNALCAMALRDYLDARKYASKLPAPGVLATAESSTLQQAATVRRGRSDRPGQKAVIREAAQVPGVARPSSVNAPCPCGSGEKYKHCHGKA